MKDWIGAKGYAYSLFYIIVGRFVNCPYNKDDSSLMLGTALFFGVQFSLKSRVLSAIEVSSFPNVLPSVVLKGHRLKPLIWHQSYL
jgi:hypothetical protein